MEVYKTDPLRYHRSLVIYLNELSLSDQTSQVRFSSSFSHRNPYSVFHLFQNQVCVELSSKLIELCRGTNPNCWGILVLN